MKQSHLQLDELVLEVQPFDLDDGIVPIFPRRSPHAFRDQVSIPFAAVAKVVVLTVKCYMAISLAFITLVFCPRVVRSAISLDEGAARAFGSSERIHGIGVRFLHRGLLVHRYPSLEISPDPSRLLE